MSIKADDVFTDKETQQLILSYLYSRGREAVSVEDTQAFLNACLNAVVVGRSVRMAADGLVHIHWDKDSGKFGFSIREAGSKAIAKNRSIWSRFRRR